MRESAIGQSSNDAADNLLTDAKLDRQPRSIFDLGPLADFFYLAVCQFATMGAIAFDSTAEVENGLRIQSAFGAGVSHIVGVSSKEKVCRIDAPVIIAPVADAVFGRNRSDVQLVADSVGEPAAAELPVSVTANRHDPVPASGFGVDDVVPESDQFHGVQHRA